jgi:hypothetical protein
MYSDSTLSRLMICAASASVRGATRLKARRRVIHALSIAHAGHGRIPKLTKT